LTTAGTAVIELTHGPEAHHASWGTQR